MIEKWTMMRVLCDVPDCDAEFEDHAPSTLGGVKEDLRRKGWMYMPAHPEKQYCPEHIQLGETETVMRYGRLVE